ncbi:hypothetical protein PR048_002975 [Dryococelus australis]|uniref:Uncharacterized protein n=1 Tax=Dryococelus australis TaxID=614101 RepID=A0ABQ9ILT9_9NEOP|nr:hypothetical protein PR048_002975 [Dryococelus australis]
MCVARTYVRQRSLFKNAASRGWDDNNGASARLLFRHLLLLLSAETSRPAEAPYLGSCPRYLHQGGRDVILPLPGLSARASLHPRMSTSIKGTRRIPFSDTWLVFDALVFEVLYAVHNKEGKEGSLHTKGSKAGGRRDVILILTQSRTLTALAVPSDGCWTRLKSCGYRHAAYQNLFAMFEQVFAIYASLHSIGRPLCTLTAVIDGSTALGVSSEVDGAVCVTPEEVDGMVSVMPKEVDGDAAITGVPSEEVDSVGPTSDKFDVHAWQEGIQDSLEAERPNTAKSLMFGAHSNLCTTYTNLHMPNEKNYFSRPSETDNELLGYPLSANNFSRVSSLCERDTLAKIATDVPDALSIHIRIHLAVCVYSQGSGLPLLDNAVEEYSPIADLHENKDRISCYFIKDETVYSLGRQTITYSYTALLYKGLRRIVCGFGLTAQTVKVARIISVNRNLQLKAICFPPTEQSPVCMYVIAAYACVVLRSFSVVLAGLSRTRQQNGATEQQNGGTPFANHRLATFSPQRSAHSEPFAACIKAVHDKVSTFEMNRRKKSLPLPAYILMGAPRGIHLVKLVTMGKYILIGVLHTQAIQVGSVRRRTLQHRELFRGNKHSRCLLNSAAFATLLMPGCNSIFPDPRLNDPNSEPGSTVRNELHLDFQSSFELEWCNSFLCRSWIKFRTTRVQPGIRQRSISLLASHQGDQGSIPGLVIPDFRMWESCRTMPLVGGFSRGSPVSPALLFQCCSIPQSPSAALKTSMLRAVQISSLTQTTIVLLHAGLLEASLTSLTRNSLSCERSSKLATVVAGSVVRRSNGGTHKCHVGEECLPAGLIWALADSKHFLLPILRTHTVISGGTSVYRNGVLRISSVKKISRIDLRTKSHYLVEAPEYLQFLPASEAAKCWSDKGDTDSCSQYVIAAKRKALNQRGVQCSRYTYGTVSGDLCNIEGTLDHKNQHSQCSSSPQCKKKMGAYTEYIFTEVNDHTYTALNTMLGLCYGTRYFRLARP